MLARSSLILLWLHTAVVSVWEAHGQSLALLRAAAITEDGAQLLILAGAGLDLLLGLALWRWHQPRVYLAAGLALLLMTAMATALLPQLWLHPLGPLSKNLAVAALLFVLFEDASTS